MSNGTTIKNLQTGDILSGDFGYTMQLPAFYEVVGFTASGKSARVRRLATADHTADGGWTGTCEPIEGRYRGDVETKLIKESAWGAERQQYVTIRDHMFSPWDGRPKYFDHLD